MMVADPAAAQRMNGDELALVFNSARMLPVREALLRVQEAVLARNGMLTPEAAKDLREQVRADRRPQKGTQ